MPSSRPAYRTLSLFLCLFGLLASASFPAVARHHHHDNYLNKHTAVTTHLVVAGITVLRGRASWYGREFQGSRTTSGERFDRFKYTCAHRTLPFGTRLRVTNIKTGKSVVVRVADRGPFRHQRILDLAEIAARPLGIVEQGAASVIAEVVAADVPLGPTTAPDNLLALVAADPDPAAAFATYVAPLNEEVIAAVATAPTTATPAPAPIADSAALVAAANSPVPAVPHFVVQAGTFAELDNASAMQARILALDPNLPVMVSSEVINGRPLNRVVIGQLDNWLAAETVRRNLQLWGIAGLVRQLPAEQIGLASVIAAATAADAAVAAAPPDK